MTETSGPGNDEIEGPFFTLLANDPHAPALIEMWAERKQKEDRADFQACARAFECARAMRKWQDEAREEAYQKALDKQQKLSESSGAEAGSTPV